NQDSTRNLMTLNFGLTATAAVIIAFWRRLPFMLLLASVLGWMAWMPLMDALWGQEGGDPVAWRTAVYGLILVAVGIVLAARGLRAYAFWLFLVGLAVSFLFLGIDAYDNALGTTGLLFLALAFAAIVISLWLEFRIFLVFGALGLYGWTSALVIETFGGSRPVAFLLIVVGAAIAAAGLGWQRWMGPRLRGRGMAPGPGPGSMPTSGA
ncbi:MAG TPA: hypothetical protein VM450_16335, partial [Thermomicrobiales bacterium]|nr:hypothetical protein [Thermomicrobiales bacterium]